MRSAIRPAIGLIRHPATARRDGRSQARQAVARMAAREGYELVKTFELTDQPVLSCPSLSDERWSCTMSAPDHDGDVLWELETTAVRVAADAVLLCGDIERARLDDISVRAHVTLLRVP